MALYAVNQTETPIILDNLACPGQVLDPGEQVDLSDSNEDYEIQRDQQLRSLIESGDVILIDGLKTLSKNEALGFGLTGVGMSLSLDGVPVGSAPATAIDFQGDMTVVDRGEGKYEVRSDGASNQEGDLPCVALRRTTSLALAQNHQAISFDQVLVQNASSSLEQSAPNSADIRAKEGGLYVALFSAPHIMGGGPRDSQNSDENAVFFEFRINGAAVPDYGEKRSPYSDLTGYGFNETGSKTGFAVLQLSADDLVSVSARAGLYNISSQELLEGAQFALIRMKGIRGSKGDPGAGSSVAVAQGGVTLSGMFETLNFLGFRVQDGGDGSVSIQRGYSDGDGRPDQGSFSIGGGDTDWKEIFRWSTTASLVSGRRYKITWYSEVQWSTTSRRPKFRVHESEDAYTLAESVMEPKDASNYVPYTGTVLYVPETTGVKSFAIEGGRQQTENGNNSRTMRVRRSNIFVEELI